MKKIWLWSALLVTLCLGIEIFFFKGFLLTPNQYINPFGGDGYFIAYHMNYHTNHGTSLQLESMNHPYGEVIFMTDAQAVVSIILNKLNHWGFPVGDQVIGIMNVLNFYLLPLAPLFIFLTFVKLEVKEWYALPVALLIGLLSPQITRIVVGHYGLGYPFLIPMLIYWMVSAKGNKKWYVFSFMVGLCILLLGLNNFYLLLIGGAFCFLGALFFPWSDAFPKEEKRKLSTIMGAVSLIPLLIGFIISQSLNHLEDRVKAPHGFLKDLDVIPSFIHPPNSFILDTFREAWRIKAAPVEGAAYLGVVPILILFAVIIFAITRRTFSFSVPVPYFTSGSGHKKLAVIFWIGVVFLLVAMHFPFYSSWKEWGYEIPFLPQFRAQRRFVWGFYYGFTILMGYWGFHFLKLLWEKPARKWIAIVCCTVGGLLWSNDVYHFLNQSSKQIFYKNPFTGEKLTAVENFAKANEINKEKYQGIYFLPTMNAWTDKLLHSGSWASYFPGMQICNVTGIPMMNLMLSRVSVGQALENLQIVSNPLVSRKLIEKLPNQKPILLLKGKEAKLHPNEEWLLQQGDTIAIDKNYVVLAYDPWNNRDSSIIKARIAFNDREINKEKDIVFNHFDEVPTDKAFYGKGAKRIAAHEKLIWEGIMSNRKVDSTYEASLWVYVDTERAGLPFWKIKQLDQQDQLLDQQRVWTMRSRETQNGWLRVDIPFQLKEKTVKLQLESDYQFDCWMDEFLIREKNDVIFHESAENPSFFSYNNFLIENKNEKQN